MTNFGAKILNNAVSSLAAQQALIANAGNNIANVNTPGYTRRSIELQTRFGGLGTTGIQIGNGVQVGGIRRIADEFLEKLLRESQASRSSYQTQDEFLSRIENLFSLTGDRPTIGSSLTSFYAAINDLSLNPSSIELRSNLIQKAQDLVENIRNTYNTLANLQSEADQRIGVELQTVNSITAQIANLNTLISQREAAGENIIASDERDARDQLLKELSEKLSFNKVELPDGSVTLTLSNGFALVNGSNSRALSLTTAPSFATSTLPPSLGGGVLGYIVYDYSAGSGTAHVDFTQDLMAGGGSIGGLLKMRGYADPTNTNAFQASGVIPELGARVEAITRSLLTDFNLEYLGPDRGDTGTSTYDPSSGDLDGQPPAVFGFFDFNFSGVKDRNTPDGVPGADDLDDIVSNTTTKNFSSILQLTSSDPRDIAAARDIGAGFPAAAVFAPGDASNLIAIAGLQNTQFDLSAGGFSLDDTTLDSAFNEMVTHVGNLKSASTVSLSVAERNFNTISDRRDEISAVSLDEEFSSLITFQKAYQASARMIRIADELLQELLQVL